MESLIGDKFKPENAPFPTGNIYQPWYTYDSIVFLSYFLRHKFRCFEWGSGASTIWIAQRVKSLVTIEHDEEWFMKVSKVLREKKLTNVTLKHISEETPAYIDAINLYKDGYFDVIFVDGAGGSNRLGAARNAVDKLRNNGLLVVDNSQTLRCKQGMDFLRFWPSLDTFNGKWSTSIYVKPKGATCESFRYHLKQE